MDSSVQLMGYAADGPQRLRRWVEPPRTASCIDAGTLLVFDQAQRQRSLSRLEAMEPCYSAGVSLLNTTRIAPALMTEIPALLPV
jgi:hypothetical protein